MLFENMSSYSTVSESLESVTENYTGTLFAPTERAFAAISCENAQEVARLESALYVADAILESKLLDGEITFEQAEVVSEGAIKDFIGKIVEALKKAWNKIKGWFVSLKNAIKAYTMNAKKFIKEYESEIRDKAKNSKLQVKTYNYDIVAGLNACAAFSKYVEGKLDKLCGTTPRDVDGWKDVLSKVTSNADEATTDDIVWKDCTMGKSWSDISKAVMDKFAPSEADKYNVGELPIDTFIKVIKDDEYDKKINETFKNLDNKYKRSIADLERAQKAVENTEKDSDKKANMAKYVRTTTSAISSLTSLSGDIGQLSVSMYKTYSKNALKVCRAIVAHKAVKDSYTRDNSGCNDTLLESVLSMM